MTSAAVINDDETKQDDDRQIFSFQVFPPKKRHCAERPKPSKSETRKPRGVKAADDDGLKFVDRVCVGVRVCECVCVCVCAFVRVC